MRLLLCVGLMLALARSCFGLGAALNETAARDHSDIIAHVLITGTKRIKPAPEKAPGALADELDRFQQIATARVLTPIKGCQTGDVLSLLFDNGFGCPNILYQDQEECLVFLQRNSAGHYTTMNLYTGRFSMKEGQVVSFYLLGPREKTPVLVPLQTVIDWFHAMPAKEPETIEQLKEWRAWPASRLSGHHGSRARRLR